MAAVDQQECGACQVECEIEWRARISLADMQKLILTHFRDQSDVWIDEYRVKRFAQYQRRVGSRSHYHCYTFSTIRDFLLLHGLSPFYLATESGKSHKTVNGHSLVNGHIYPFSELKTTNCAHLFYTFSSNSTLLANNTWPRILVIKRSLEIVNFEKRSLEIVNFESGVQADQSLDKTVQPAQSVDAIQQLFADYQRNEMDRSDNNFGAAYVRKIYRLIPFNGVAIHDQSHLNQLRLAVYSIFDEYQQIRYEVAIEYEFNQTEKCMASRPYGCPRSPCSTQQCASAKVVKISADGIRLDTVVSAISEMIDHLIAPCLYYVEKPMIKINIDWLEGITSPTVIRMLSYPVPSEQTDNEENFANYLLARLKYLANPLISKQAKYRYHLRRKLDGERLFATYNGGHFLCLSNGERFDLRPFCCVDTSSCGHDGRCYLSLLSVDFIYQIERVNQCHYYITEVVAARHSYSMVLNSLVHSFSPSKNFYRATDEQIWPYGLIGTGLDEHSTASLIDFWIASACQDIAHQSITRDIIETLRDNQTGQYGKDNDSDSENSVSSNISSWDAPEQPVTGQSLNLVNMDEEQEESQFSGGSTTSAHDGATGEVDGCYPLETTSDVGSLTNKKKKINDSKIGDDGETNDGETHSRFFVPICASDSRRYLLMLDRRLSSLTINNGSIIASSGGQLRVNIPLPMMLLSKQEVIDYYRAYVIRILNVLLLCGEQVRCIHYAHKHFSCNYAREIESAFSQQRHCLSTSVNIDMGGNRERMEIDGYLLYRECNDSGFASHYQQNKDSNLCALPPVLARRSEVTSILKLKPFQTIELLMRVDVPVCAEETRSEAIVPVSISFLSQLCSDEVPPLFFVCSFPPAPCLTKDSHPHLRSIEPDFKRAKWQRYDEKSIEVFVDPRLELIDGVVYEFLCYNEFEFYLIKARPDKVLPDDESKISHIVWSRKSSESFFVL